MSTEQQMKTCKECKVEKCINEFAMSRRVGEKIYRRSVCCVCWGLKQKNKYNKKYSNVKHNKKLINKITDMRSDGEKWRTIAETLGYSTGYLLNIQPIIMSH